MGRPLKIKKSSVPFSGTDIDAGFNIFSQLTNPVIPAGMTSDEFLGVVGGLSGLGEPDFPVVQATANLYGTEYNAFIITQKGATKYLIGLNNIMPVTDIVPGRSYIIEELGDTDWESIGANINPNQDYDLFTATAVGTGTGTVNEVGIAALANQASGSVTQGNMQITLTALSATVQVSKLTNKFVWDYTDQRYAVNFFVDGAAVTAKSGAEIETFANGTGELSVALIQNVT